MQTANVHTWTLFDVLSPGPIHKIPLSEIYIYVAKVIYSFIWSPLQHDTQKIVPYT
jgi:hypothetical protein